jgi:4,5-DOPA dioxygenase extradiol
MTEFDILAGNLIPSDLMPLLFVGHGSPMNAIEDNIYSRKWIELGQNLPHPQAILSISAHWLTSGTKVTAMEKPSTIHDFGGFPEELFRQEYPAPGSPEMADSITSIDSEFTIREDHSWGLDHGTWSILKPMFPLADIPVIQLSIDYSKPPEYHFELARQLSKLREKGVLVMGSGNMVHNLRQLRFDEKIPDWSEQFDTQISQWIEAGDDHSILRFQELGSVARMAHPTYDHFLPLLYVLGMKSKSDQPEFFNTGFQMGSISMRSVIWK